MKELELGSLIEYKTRWDYGLAVVTKITRDCKGEGTFEVKWIKQLVNGNEAGDKEDWLTESGIHLLGSHNEIFRVIA